MSSRDVRAAESILNNLLKAKGQSRDLIRDLNRAESGLLRVNSIAAQLARGDVTGLIPYVAQMGPWGWKVAAVIGLAAIAYGIYQKVTEERPTELYFWRYPE